MGAWHLRHQRGSARSHRDDGPRWLWGVQHAISCGRFEDGGRGGRAEWHGLRDACSVVDSLARLSRFAGDIGGILAKRSSM